MKLIQGIIRWLLDLLSGDHSDKEGIRITIRNPSHNLSLSVETKEDLDELGRKTVAEIVQKLVLLRVPKAELHIQGSPALVAESLASMEKVQDSASLPTEVSSL